jgi:hypothetical protein
MRTPSLTAQQRRVLILALESYLAAIDTLKELGTTPTALDLDREATARQLIVDLEEDLGLADGAGRRGQAGEPITEAALLTDVGASITPERGSQES